jgi:hypothetical protein
MWSKKYERRSHSASGSAIVNPYSQQRGGFAGEGSRAT